MSRVRTPPGPPESCIQPTDVGLLGRPLSKARAHAATLLQLSDAPLPLLKAFLPTDELCKSYCLAGSWLGVLRPLGQRLLKERQVEEARAELADVVERTILACLQERSRRGRQLEIPRECFSELRHRFAREMPGSCLGDKTRLASHLLLQVQAYLASHERVRLRGLDLKFNEAGLTAVKRSAERAALQ